MVLTLTPRKDIVGKFQLQQTISFFGEINIVYIIERLPIL